MIGFSSLAAILLIGVVALVYQLRDDSPNSNGSGPVARQPGGAEILEPGTPNTTVTLAVMDFENHSNVPDLDGFRLGFRDMLVTDFSRVSSVKVLERAKLAALLEEHKLAKTPFIDPKSAVRLGKGLSA